MRRQYYSLLTNESKVSFLLTNHIAGFIRALKPPHVVLVHGEANEMSRLKAALIGEYENDPSYNIEVHNPRNTVSVDLYFRGEKMAKV